MIYCCKQLIVTFVINLIEEFNYCLYDCTSL